MDSLLQLTGSHGIACTIQMKCLHDRSDFVASENENNEENLCRSKRSNSGGPVEAQRTPVVWSPP